MTVTPQGLLMRQKSLIKFDKVFEEVSKLHDQNFDDKVVDMATIRITKDLHLDVPGVGILTMTDWSKRQLGSILGVTWDRWFGLKDSKGQPLIKPHEIQEELQRRFSRNNDCRKIRARRFKKGSPGVKGADGFLRAVLSPTYAAIDDVRVFDRMAKRFRGQMRDVNFMKNHLGTDFYNDRTSHYTVVGEPINLGPIDRKHPDKRIRDIYALAEREGKLPDSDWVYQGYHLRNSEVGNTALTMDSNTFRLVCLNGCVMSVKDGRLLYRMHRAIDNEAIDSLLDGAFRKMPAAWEANRRRLSALKDTRFEKSEEVEIAIKRFLERQKATKSFQQAVVEAWEAEPLMSRYGILQAITRAAKEERDMDKRFELEELGGRYAAQAAA